MEVAALGLKVEGVSSIEQAASSLDHLASSAGKAEKATTTLDPTSKKSSQAVQQLGKSSDSTSSSLNSLGSTATKVGGVLAAAFSVTKVIQYADAWSDMQSRVGAATGQMDLAAGNMQRLLQIANASYSPLQQTAEIYARNVSTFRDLGRGASEAADFTESLNNMLVLTATRGERAASVQNALSKAMAVGKIEADGLETVLANGGEVAQALARELGTTVSGLRSMASQGKITGDVIASAVVKSLDDVRDRAAEMPATMGDAWTRVGNNLTAFVGIMDQATGASGSLANAIISVSDAALEIATSGDVIAGFVAWKGTIEAIAQDFVELDRIISEFTSNATGSADSISFSFGEMPANIRAMIKIAVVEIASFIDAQMNGIRALGAAIEALPSGPSAAMDAFNAVRAQMERLGQVRLDSINDILAERDAIIQAGRDAANSYAETGRKALEFNGAVAQTTGTVGTFTKEQEKAVKALSDFVSQSALSVSNAAAMTAAYLSGSEAVAKLTREQKIEAEVLKLGEKNRAEVTRRINEMEDALESLDLAKSIAQMRDQNKELTAYGKVLAMGGTATKAGREALKTFNNEREIEAALVGKTSAEITKLIPKLREEQKLRDSLRDGNARIEKLNALVAETRTVTEKANIELAELAELASSTKDPVYLDAINRKMQEVQASTSEWGQFTERALDSVDQAFADAWRNIDQGFSGFADGLKNAFKNLLAELAHMAITRPIVMQIGVALGVGGMAGQSSGLFGMLGGGSGGGMGGMLSSASNLYSLFQAGQGQGLLGSIFSGFKSGGFGGAFNGATSYFGNMFGGIDQGLGQIYGVLTNGSGSTYAPLSYQAGVQGWGNMAATAAPWLAGGLGALMGYQNAGVKGAAAGAGGAAAGYYAGSALGSVVPGLGTAIGGAIGAALGGVLGGSLFGGKWQTKDVGIALGIKSGALSAQKFEYQKKKGGLFSSNKKRTRYYDLDPGTAAALGDAYAATADSVFDLFESLSYTIEDNALAGLNMAKTQISTKGKSEEEIQQAIAEWFGTAADAMTAELQSVFGTGLDLDFAGMQQFVGNLKGVNEVIRYLNVGMFDASVAGGKLAEQLSGISGGLENLANNAGTYYSAFFTEAEKIENTIDSIKRAFESADTELASSREAYRAMVEDIDMTTEAGQQMFATLMALSGQAAAYYDILESRSAVFAAAFTTSGQKMTDALSGLIEQFDRAGISLPETRAGFAAAVAGIDQTTEAGRNMYAQMIAMAGQANAYYSILESNAQAAANAAVSGAQSALSTLSNAIAAQKNSIVASYQAQANAIRESLAVANSALVGMRNVANSLRSTVSHLLSEQTTYAGLSRRMGQQVISDALGSGGKIQLDDHLNEALSAVSKSSEGLFVSFEEYSRDYWKTYFQVEELANRAEDQVTEAERAVSLLESQLKQNSAFQDAEMERLDGILEQANSQLEALLGIDTSVQSVESALTTFAAAIQALQKQQNANSSVTSVTGLGGVRRNVNSEGYVLDEIGNAMTLFGQALRIVDGIAYGGDGASLKVGADGKLTWLTGDYERWARENNIPGFATGGAFTNGIVSRPTAFNMGVMGEAGSEGILPLANIGGRLGVHANIGGNDAAELKAVRAELSEMKRVLVEIMWSSKATENATRSMDEGGIVIDKSSPVMA